MKSLRKILTYTFLVAIIFSYENLPSKEQTTNDEFEPPEISNGERLFLETRFAQLFYEFLINGGSTNQPIPKGDPVLNETVRFFGLPPYQIPFTKSPFAPFNV